METILCIKIKSYGHIEIKRELIHGSAVYGMLSSSLLDLYGFNKDIKLLAPDHPFKKLYKAWGRQKLRFFPFIPIFDDANWNNNFDINNDIDFPDKYNYYAYDLYQGGKRKIITDNITIMAGIQTDQFRGTIHGRNANIKVVHRPFCNYYGMIMCSNDVLEYIEEAINYLPFIKIGKRGKMSLLEANIEKRINFTEYQKNININIEEAFNITPIPLFIREDNNPTNSGRTSDMLIKNDFVKNRMENYLNGGSNLLVAEKYRFERYGPYFTLFDNDKPLRNVGNMTDKKKFRLTAVCSMQKLSKLNNPLTKKDFFYGLGEPGSKMMGFGQIIYKPNI